MDANTTPVRAIAYNANKAITKVASEVTQLTLLCDDDRALENYIERNEAHLKATYATFATYDSRKSIKRTRDRKGYSVTFWKVALDPNDTLTALGLSAN